MHRALYKRLLLPIAVVALFDIATGLKAQNTIGTNPQAQLVSAPALRLTGEVDSNSPALWDLSRGIPLFYVVTSFGGRPSTARGRSLTQLGGAQPVTLDPWPGGGVWMEAIVPDVDGTWYGYYHNEIPATSVCPGSDKVIPRIGAARSRDRGRTWEQLGIILEAPASTFTCSTNNIFFVNGVGDFSVQLDPDSLDVYFFLSQYESSSVQQGVAVARLRWADRDEPVGKVMVWRTRVWIPAARQIEVGDETTWAFGAGVPIFPVTDGWHDAGTTTDAFWGPSVHWNTYLRLYVMLLNRAKDTKYNTEGIYVSFTSRLNDPRLWSVPMKIVNSGGWYPQVIGLDEGAGTDKVAGEWARFFMAGTSQHFIHFTR